MQAMFSLMCRNLDISARLVSRQLSTLESISRTDPVILNHTKKGGEVASLIQLPSKAMPIAESVYLALANPLKRTSSDPRPDENLVILDPSVFNHPIRRDILHLCVVHHLDSLRQGSANTKTRGEVRGSGIKIRRQKGSGKARLGDGQSPMLVGGGVAFGPKPRDFSTKLPRKVIEMGMRVALSVKVREQTLGVVSRLDWPNGKTKHLSQKIDMLGLRKTLFVTGEERIPVGLERAIRNIPQVKLIRHDKLTVYDVLKWQRLVMDVKAVDFLERTLKKDLPIVPIPLLQS